MPSQKKTKTQKAQASGAARGKTSTKTAKLLAQARPGRAAATNRGAAKSATSRSSKNRTAAASTKSKVSRAASAKTAAKKTSAPKTSRSRSESARTVKHAAKAAATRTAVVKKTAAAKAAENKTAKTASAKAAIAKSSVTKTAKVKAAEVKASTAQSKVKAGAPKAKAPVKNAPPEAPKDTAKPVKKAAPAKPAILAAPARPVAVKAAAPAPAAPPKQSTSAEATAPKKVAQAVTPRPAGGKPSLSTPTASPQLEEKPVLEAPTPRGLPIVKQKPSSQKLGFKLNEFIVYPAHGVGQITAIEVQEVAGFNLELFVVSFIKDKMILKVPTSKVANVGMRKLAEGEIVDKALSTLSGRARIKRTMWSRRAQEYEAKINSGDLVTIAEVVRDLYRSDTQPEQSYSERQLYEAALDRMAREIAAVRKLIDAEALKLIEAFLLKGPRRGPKSEGDAVEEAESDVGRAA